MQKITRHLIQQAQFCLEYCVDFHGTNAAIRAGYAPDGAACASTKLLKQSHIKKAINRELSARQKRTLITSDRTLAEMYEIGFCEPRKAYNQDGTLKNIKDFPSDVAKAISEIESVEMFETDKQTGERKLVGYTRKVKLHSKLEALKSIGKHLGLFPDKVINDGTIKHEHTVKVEAFDINERIDMYQSIN